MRRMTDLVKETNSLIIGTNRGSILTDRDPRAVNINLDLKHIQEVYNSVST